MKKMMIYLNSMKSRCFMLVACVILVLGVTSCNSDDFESIAPDEQKELSNAELIEQALSRIPKTRAGAPMPVVMMTNKSTVTFSCEATEDMMIYWGDGSTTPVIKNTYDKYTHTHSNVQPSYVIFLEGPNEAIKSLYLLDNELTLLDVTNNTNLEYLQCGWNKLPDLDLTGCPNLRTIDANFNNLSSIDVTHLPHLEKLVLNRNQLTNIDVSNNLNLRILNVGHNKITDIDLIKNINLIHIGLSDLSLKTINSLSVSSTSFAGFSKLKSLDISHTPFTSLDLSNNPSVTDITMSQTAITQLDISNLQIEYLLAEYSQLTNLIYTSNNLINANTLAIKYTPFEKLSSNLNRLIIALPDKSETMAGVLRTTSSTLITPWLTYLTAKNWVVPK